MGNLVRLHFKVGTHNWTCPPGVKQVVCRTFDPNIAVAHAGYSNACAINTQNGCAYFWGDNVFGRLGDNTILSRSTPTLTVPASRTWADAKCAVADSTSGYATRSGALYMFGGGAFGQLGNGTINNASTPTHVGSAGLVKYLVGTWGATPGYITENGLLYRWGSNAYGQIGGYSNQNQSVPVFVSVNSVDTWWAVSGAFYGQASIGMLNNGRVYTWGRNNVSGLLGQGDLINRSAPTLVSTLGEVQMVFGSTEEMMGAIDLQGNAYMWGNNAHGQLGDGTTQNRSTPTLVAGDRKWVWLAIGTSATAGIDTAGDVYVWGANSFGALGGASLDNVSTPTKVPSLGGAHYIMAMNNAFIAYQTPPPSLPQIRMAGWGSNEAGRLGDGTVTIRSTPVSVGNAQLFGSQCVDYGTAVVQTIPGTQYQITVSGAAARFANSLVGPNIRGAINLYLEYFT